MSGVDASWTEGRPVAAATGLLSRLGEALVGARSGPDDLWKLLSFTVSRLGTHIRAEKGCIALSVDPEPIGVRWRHLPASDEHMRAMSQTSLRKLAVPREAVAAAWRLSLPVLVDDRPVGLIDYRITSNSHQFFANDRSVVKLVADFLSGTLQVAVLCRQKGALVDGLLARDRREAMLARISKMADTPQASWTQVVEEALPMIRQGFGCIATAALLRDKNGRQKIFRDGTDTRASCDTGRILRSEASKVRGRGFLVHLLPRGRRRQSSQVLGAVLLCPLTCGRGQMNALAIAKQPGPEPFTVAEGLVLRLACRLLGGIQVRDDQDGE